MKQIQFLYEDEDILVCHKPAGIATEGAKVSSIDLISAARNYIARKSGAKGVKPYVATVHRLDQPVEGVVILAKTKKAAGSISEQIKNRKTEKYYYALCYGNVPSDSGKLTDYLVRREDSLAMVVSEDEKDSYKDGVITLSTGEKIRCVGGDVKKAELEYTVIYRDENATLLKIKLLTGRFHQIRVQLSHMGFPILGERSYASAESQVYSEENNIRNICLVSYRFVLRHPSTGKRCEFEITPDNEQIRTILSKVGE